MRSKSGARNTLGAWLVFAAALGTALFYRDFAKIRLGPLYLLELLSAIALLVASPTLLKSWREYASRLRWVYAFTALGLVLVLRDLVLRSSELVAPERFLQHAGMAVYPALWTTLGYFSLKARPSTAKGVLLACGLITSVMFFLIFGFAKATFLDYEFYANIATGPLAMGWLAVCLDRIVKHGRHVLGSRGFLAETALALVLALTPYCAMWSRHVQRTSLVAAVFTLVVTPLLLNRLKLLPALRSAAVGLAVFATALGLTIAVTKLSPMQTLQHGEDVPQPTAGNAHLGSFQNRFRGFVWAQTIQDWKPAPVFGIGFIPEVPSWIAPYQKNDANYNFKKDPNHRLLEGKPVSGPHNSYLNVLARMGLVGLLLFAILLVDAGRRIITIARSPKAAEPATIAMILIFLNGLLYAFFHTGLESGYNCYLLWVALGMIHVLGKKT